MARVPIIVSALLAPALCACGSQHAAAPSPASQRAAAATTSAAVAPRDGVRRTRNEQGAVGFAVLRRAVRHTDALPARAAEAVRRGNEAHLTGNITLDARSARRVSLRGIPPLWVLGGRRAVCLIAAGPAAGRRGVEYALSCLPPAQATLGLLVRTYIDVALRPPRTLVEGIVPDSARSVALNLGGERRKPLELRENAYAGLAQAPLSVILHTRTTTHSVPLPLAPGSAGVLLGAAG